MKMFFKTILFALIAVAAASCSRNSSPSDAMACQLEAMQNRDVNAIIDGIYFKNETDKDLKKQLTPLINNKVLAAIDEKDGIANYTILSEKINESGDEATVKYSIVFGNGEEQQDEAKCVMVDGKWKVDGGK